MVSLCLDCAGNAPYKLRIDDEGKLIISDSDGKVTWNRGSKSHEAVLVNDAKEGCDLQVIVCVCQR